MDGLPIMGILKAFTSGFDDLKHMKFLRTIGIAISLPVVLWLLWLILSKCLVKSLIYTDSDVAHYEVKFATLELLGWVLDHPEQRPASLYEAMANSSDLLIPGRWKISKCAVDSWGTPYLFLIGTDTIKVWSCGPNRKNENGCGDDIVFVTNYTVRAKLDQ